MPKILAFLIKFLNRIRNEYGLRKVICQGMLEKSNMLHVSYLFSLFRFSI